MYIFCRFFKHQLSTLEMFFPDIDNGATCPLCPKVRPEYTLDKM